MGTPAPGIPPGLEASPIPSPRRQGAQQGSGSAARARWANWGTPVPPPAADSMETAAGAQAAGSAGPRERGLCVLCGLPAAGKSTFARALGRRLRQERGWTVGVLSYDDVLPDASLDSEGARPPVSTGRAEGAERGHAAPGARGRVPCGR